MFKRLVAVYGVVKDSGAVEAITRGPDGFVQVMVFPWFCASVLVLCFPPGRYTDGSIEVGIFLGVPGLCLAFMICSVLHVVLLVFMKVRRYPAAMDDGGQSGLTPEAEPEGSGSESAAPSQ